jgi:hypothetical protein
MSIWVVEFKVNVWTGRTEHCETEWREKSVIIDLGTIVLEIESYVYVYLTCV